MPGKIPTVFERSWKWRRVAVFSQMAFADLILLYFVVAPWWLEEDIDTVLNRDIAQAAFLYLTVIITGYVFGGIWDDKVKGQEIAAAGPGTIQTTMVESKVTTTPSAQQQQPPQDNLQLDPNS